jgi:hypothetical protein
VLRAALDAAPADIEVCTNAAAATPRSPVRDAINDTRGTEQRGGGGRCARTEIAVGRVEHHARRRRWLRGVLLRFGVAPGPLRRWLRGLVVRRRH